MSGSRTSGSTNEKIEYNGYEFEKQGGLWYFEIEGQKFVTSYTPQETQEIAIAEISLEEYSGKPVYYVTNGSKGVNELMTNIVRYFQRTQEVCLKGEECRGDFVEKDCNSSIIIFKTDEEFENINIYRQNNCLFIESKPEKIIKASDRVVFKLLDIQE